MKIPPILVAFLSVAALGSGVASGAEPVDCVDPLIGTGHSGKTYPGVATPGGMVQLRPDTVTGGDNGSGYRYRDSTLQGFSFTHMIGVGSYDDLGNLLVMPTTGPLQTRYGQTDRPADTGYASGFPHATETAGAGYYAVALDRYGVRAEATAAPHSGMLRFTFTQAPDARIQIDLARRVGGTSLHQTVKVVDDHSMEGRIDCAPDGGGWGRGAGKVRYTFYYHAEFGRPLGRTGTWTADLPADGRYTDAIETSWFAAACRGAAAHPGAREAEGRHIGFCAEVPANAGDAVSLKVGISFVSVAGTRANLAAELARMDVAGGTDAMRAAFYTALYHVMLDTCIFADVNGDHPGGDGQPRPPTESAMGPCHLLNPKAAECDHTRPAGVLRNSSGR